MIVRLKETPENGVFGGENSFNSMIVRLKDLQIESWGIEKRVSIL